MASKAASFAEVAGTNIEVAEMFGITFHGMKNPDHLYLPENWPEKTYPLLKDFDPESLKTLHDLETENGN